MYRGFQSLVEVSLQSIGYIIHTVRLPSKCCGDFSAISGIFYAHSGTDPEFVRIVGVHSQCLGCGFLSEGDFKVDDEVNFIDADRLAQSTVKPIFPCGR
jgi:hypothetical protein